VWNHNTPVSKSTNFTSFRLLFGDEEVTLEEIKLGSSRALASTEDEENEKVSKDTIEESRLEAIEHIRKYQSETIRWQDSTVQVSSSVYLLHDG
jgi:hypothetical protein